MLSLVVTASDRLIEMQFATVGRLDVWRADFFFFFFVFGLLHSSFLRLISVYPGPALQFIQALDLCLSISWSQ